MEDSRRTTATTGSQLRFGIYQTRHRAQETTNTNSRIISPDYLTGKVLTRRKRRRQIEFDEEVKQDAGSSAKAQLLILENKLSRVVMRRRLSSAALVSVGGGFLTLLLATCLLVAANQADRSQEQPIHQQQQQPNESTIQILSVAKSDQEPEALALRTDNNKQQDSTSTNVIIIKYANVTKCGTAKDASQANGAGAGYNCETADGEQQNPQLNVLKLYEPLSVSVIESKFAQSIQLFDVSQNQLSSLSKDLFCPLSNEVKQLNISHNLLENFDCLGLISVAGQLCLSELRVLDMSFNLIKHLPATGVATLENLEVLNLSHNLIDSLDELSLSSLFKLTRLDLSANRIQQLPIRIFHKSTSMQVLRLQSNHLQTSISQNFLAGLISLEEINLSHNNISHVIESPFLDKVNLTRVDLSYNQLTTLRQEALRVTSVQQASGYRHRLHHNGQYAGVAPKQTHSQSVSAEFFLSSNPFICDCQLEWLRKFQPSAMKRTVLAPSNNRALITDPLAGTDQQDLNGDQLSSSNLYQNDQPPVILAPRSVDSSNNISEIISNQQQAVDSSLAQTSSNIRPSGGGASVTTTSASHAQQPQHSLTNHYARIADLDLIKCTPSFRRNNQRSNNLHHHDTRQVNYHRSTSAGQSNGQPNRAQAPSDGHHHSQLKNGGHHHQSTMTIANGVGRQHQQQQDTMIDLLSADSSNFLCRYKSHCFALCHCCEFDACDCEMICPTGCNCYYDSTWQTNIIDCSSSNHTVVPDRIPMDVSGLYLDGNNIDSLKPSNLIARKSLKTLYLNSSNLHYIANRTFNGLIELQTLYLHENMLRTLNGYEFEPLAQLKALYLQSNRLDRISNQTFIYLRSLEILDLSNNRLTSMNLDLFWSVGHHNIRLRQLSIAHNWWDCQCSLINRFRQILKQKFLLNGSVNIADKNSLRCYYNSTTVGPLILADGSMSSASGALPPQPLYASYPATSNRQQTQLTEINSCSETILSHGEFSINPPIVQPVTDPPQSLPPSEYPNDPNQNPSFELPGPIPNPDQPLYPQQPNHEYPPGVGAGQSGPRIDPSNGMPVTTYVLLFLLLAGVMAILASVFLLVQQRFHQSHHKKSSASSTTSASSSASSTAISSLNGKSHRNQSHTLHGPHHAPPHHHHLIMSNGSGGATTTSINHHHQHLQQPHHTHHHHSASSQSNIYAALVSPTTGNSTSVSNAINNGANNMISTNNNLYSNSSSTASHHSSSSHVGANGYPAHWQSVGHPLQQQQQQQQQSIYNQPYGGIGGVMENHYTINASSQASYKTGSLYNAPNNNCHDARTPSFGGANAQSDWIKLPKVKQFMSKLVNKSLALGGYRSCSRDELSAITSDKIYDAFISYDKHDEAFVMQHLSAELEYGQPQYRIANRFRDLPLPTSAYIAEAITSVIGCSHRTIIVLTENYLASEWCRYELQAALHESSVDKAHKIIAVVLDPKCLLEMDNEMRALLTNSNVSIYQPAVGQQQQQQPQQLVQLDGMSVSEQQQQQQQQLVATLTNLNGAGNQQICTQTTQLATSKITFINYNQRKFWPKIKQLMPLPRPSTQTLTLTTKN